MLAAIVERLSHTMPHVKLAVNPSVGPYEDRVRYGLLQRFDAATAGRLGWLREKLLHEGYQRRYGLVRECDVVAILDTSGFALGDVLPEAFAHSKARKFARWRSQGKEIILLPQAMGPFGRPATRDASRLILESSNLIFARDVASFDHASKLVPGHHGLRLARDFTNLVDGPHPSISDPSRRRAAIIPNAMMLRHGTTAMQEAYVPFMARCVEQLREIGIDPCILLYETNMDRELAEEICQRVPGGAQILEEQDAVKLKGITGEFWLTVGSRFHGLVNALSQGVPSVGTSWSHKYLALFSDYERPNWLLDPTMDPDGALELLSGIIQNREAEHLHLLSCSSRLKCKTAKMWAEVEELLKKSNKVNCKSSHGIQS